MTTLQVNCFLEVAKCLNFSKAAANLYISQPSLSRNIVQLEKELHVKLFTRNSFQGTSLTEAGECMLAAFQQTQGIIDKAIAEARSLNDQKVYTIMLGVLDGQMLDQKFHDMISEFKKAYPNIRIKVISGGFQELNLQLDSDELDLILTLGCELSPRTKVCSSVFYTLPTYLVIPKDFELDEGTKEHSLAEFAELPFVYAKQDDAPYVIDLLHKACQSAGFMPKIEFVDSLKEQTMSLEMGNGAAGFNSLHAICHSPNVRTVTVKEFTAQDFLLAWKEEPPHKAIRIFTQWFDSWHKTYLSHQESL